MTIVKVLKREDIVEGNIENKNDSVDKEITTTEDVCEIEQSKTKEVLDNIKSDNQEDVG